MSSGTVDTKTVEMRFDNQNFEKNCKESMSTLEKLKAALKLDGASKGLSDIEKAANKLDMRDLQGNIETVGSKFSILETIATGVFLRIGMAAADAGARIIKSLTIDQLASGWGKYEEKTTAVQTIMANLRDDAEKFTDDISKMDYVNEQIEKLNWFSDETSYSLTDMTSNIGKFVANGQGLEESVTAMEGIATWAAISGQNSTTAARAMYNISQAMGTGSMKIKDWMSIENANMATAEFKEAAITIAENMGKIKKGQVTIENFRESLSGKGTNGWFDKEVMMATFEEYGSAVERVRGKIEEVREETAKNGNEIEITASKAIQMLKEEDSEFAKSLGFRAFAAAQEAKTLKEALAATGDAVSTKWMQIFELIFGNYLQQKELWTDLANDLWDVFAAPLDTVKNILNVWNKGFGEESGRDMFISGLKNIFNAFIHDTEETTSLFGIIKEAFSDTFFNGETIDSLGKKLFDLTAKFRDFTASLIPSEETLQKIKSSFEGLFGIFKIGAKFLKAIIKPFGELFSKAFKGIGSTLLDATSGLGKWIKNVETFLEQNRVFEKISNTITSAFDKIASAVNSLSLTLTGMSFADLKDKLKTDFIERIGAFVEGIKAIFAKDHDNLAEGGNKFKSFILLLKDIFETIVSSLSGLLEPVGRIFGLIGSVFAKGAKTFANALQKDGVFGVIKSAIKIGVGVLIAKFLISLIDSLQLVRKAGWVLDGLYGVLKQVQNLLRALQFKVIAQGIKDIGIAVLLMALSVAALGSMDRSALIQGLLALLAIVGIIAVLKTIISGITGLNGLGASAAFLSFGIAIGLLTAAVAVLGNMDKNAMARGEAAILGLTLIFGLFKAMMGTVGGINLIASAAAFGLFAAAIDILAIGVKALGSMSTGDLLKGELAIAGLVLIFALFKTLCRTVTGIDLILATAAFAIFAAAIDILAIGVKALGSMSIGDLAKGEAAVAGLVLIFAMFKALCTTIMGIDLILATAAFAIFAAAIDILSIGVKALGSMSTGDLAKGEIAVAGLTLVFAMFKALCTTILGTDLILATAAFAIFAAAIDIITLGIRALGDMSGSDLTEAVVAVAALVAIFGIFKTFCTTATSIDLIGASAAFTLFAAAVDIIAIGVVALGQLDLDQITNGIIAIAAMVGLYGVLNMLSAGSGGMLTSSIGFLAFSVAIVAVAAALNMMIPVMDAIIGMGDSWWKPLVFLGAALAMVVAAGVISGLPLVSAGLIILTASLIGIAAACLIAGAGIYLIAESIADLVEAIAIYGPEASENMSIWLNALLDSIIETAPKMLAAAIVLIKSFALGIIANANIIAGAILVLLVTILNTLSSGMEALAASIVNLIVSALHMIATVIRAASYIILPALMDILSAIIELVIEVVAELVGTIPIWGGDLADSIRGWKTGVNEALTHVFSDSKTIGEDACEALLEGFSGGGGGHRFGDTGEEKGQELAEGINKGIDEAGKTTTKAGVEDYLTQVGDTVSEYPLGDKAETMMNGMVSSITSGGSSSSAEFNAILAALGIDMDNFGLGGITDGKMAEMVASITSGGDSSTSEFSSILSSLGIDLDAFGLGDLTDAKMEEMLAAILSGGDSSTSEFESLVEALGVSVDDAPLGDKTETKMEEVTTAIENEQEPASNAANEVVSSIQSEMTSMNSYSWGSDLGAKFASGISSKTATVRSAALALANAVSAVLHFSEPDEGPLSNFHTFAPDMVKLWNKGIYDNLGSVESSSESMANTIYDGFSTALDYVSDLIDDGMSDELTIRPIMDLSEIQNGISSLNGMIGSADGYSLSGTARLASSAAYSMSGRATTATDTTAAVPVAPVNNYNTFNITNNDPSAVAQKVSKLLDQDTRRAQAVWARR